MHLTHDGSLRSTLSCCFSVVLERGPWCRVVRVAFMALTLLAAHAADPVPVAQWSFNESAGATAASVPSGFTASLQSGAGWFNGPVNGCLYLDGVGHALVADAAALRLTSAATIVAWIRIPSPNEDAWMRIVSKKAAWDAVDGYEVEYNPALDELHLIGSGGSIAWARMVLDDAQWHHVAAVVEGTSVQLYVDGAALTMQESEITALVAGTAPLAMGRHLGGGGQFEGGIDDVRLYHRALTAAEVARVVQEADAKPVAIWGFEEATGATIGDASGAGNVGTINGATRVIDATRGKVLAFDGVDDQIQVPDSASLQIVGGITLAAWIKLDNAEDNAWRCIVSKKAPYEAAGGYHLAYNSGLNLLVVNASGEDAAVLSIDLDTGWHHVAVTINGTQATFYVDGVLRTAADTRCGALQASTTALCVGTTADGFIPFLGRLDDVRVYDGALSAAQIASIAVQENQPPTIVGAPQAVENPTLGSLVAVAVLGADDGGEAPLTYTWTQTGGPSQATFPAGNGSNAGKTMTARFPQAGVYDFTVAVADAHGLSVAATCSITVTALRPEIPHALYACGADYAYVEQSIRPSTPSGETWSYTITTAPTQGTATIVDGIHFRYVPSANFTGVDQFAITASNGTTTSLPAVITMTVGIDPRRSMLVRSQPLLSFDRQRWLTDIAYADSFIATPIPGRVWETAAGGPGVPMLRVIGPASLISTPQGSVLLQAQTTPFAPVTFTATANGHFGSAHRNTNTITTTADDAGVATVSFTSPPMASRCPVLIGSPAAVGTQRIVVEVQP